MDDIKRLSAFLIASSMLAANMTCALVSADEISSDGESAGTAVVAENLASDSEEEPEAAENAVEDPAEDPEGDAGTDENAEVREEQENQYADGEDSIPENFYEAVGSSAGENNKDDVNLTIEEIPQDQASSVNTGKGDIEGLVSTKIFQVTLPVQNNTLDYVADPQGLIRKTNAEKHPDCVYADNANVYFYNGTASDSGKKLFSGSSDPLTVINKSSASVTVVARVSAYYEQDAKNPVMLAGSRDWSTIDKPAVCLSVIRSDDGSETVLSKHEKVITASIAGCPEAYKYVCEDAGGEKKYSYRMMSDEEMKNADISYKTFSLRLTGECNGDCEWDPDAKYDFPSTSIVWNVGFAVSAKPYVNEGNYTVARNAEIRVPYSLGLYDAAATGITSAELTTPSGERVQILGEGSYMDFTDNEIILSREFSEYARGLGGGVLSFVFDDPDKTSAQITLDDGSVPYLEETSFEITADTQEIKIPFSYGIGPKAAKNVSSVKFGNQDFSSKVYMSLSGNGFTLKSTALRRIIEKGGGSVSVTFDDHAHTRCSFRVDIEGSD